MKNCPTCNRTFEDSFTFCLIDGAVLSAPLEVSRPTGRTAGNAGLPPPTIPTLRKPTFRGLEGPHQEVAEKRGVSKLVLGLGALLLLIAGAVAFTAGWFAWFRNDSSAQSSSPQTTNDNSIDRSTTTRRSAVNDSAPQSDATIKPASSPATRLDVIGTWSGKLAGRDAILFINTQQGAMFSGILKNTKGAIVAVSGRIDAETRQISIKENRVIEPVKEGSDWVLGSESGTLSPDGTRMSGNGRDDAGHVYTWSFAK